jgi:hypothetical protein
MAQTVQLLQEKDLTDEDALNQRIAELETKYHNALAVVKDLEGRMKANKELRYHIAAYRAPLHHRLRLPGSGHYRPACEPLRG